MAFFFRADNKLCKNLRKNSYVVPDFHRLLVAVSVLLGVVVEENVQDRKSPTATLNDIWGGDSRQHLVAELRRHFRGLTQVALSIGLAPRREGNPPILNNSEPLQNSHFFKRRKCDEVLELHNYLIDWHHTLLLLSKPSDRSTDILVEKSQHLYLCSSSSSSNSSTRNHQAAAASVALEKEELLREQELQDRKRKAIAAEDFRTAQECKELLIELAAARERRMQQGAYLLGSSSGSRSNSSSRGGRSDSKLLNDEREDARRYYHGLMQQLLQLQGSHPELVALDSRNFDPEDCLSAPPAPSSTVTYSPVASLWRHLLKNLENDEEEGQGHWWGSFWRAAESFIERGGGSFDIEPPLFGQTARKRRVLSTTSSRRDGRDERVVVRRAARVEAVWETVLGVLTPLSLQLNSEPVGTIVDNNTTRSEQHGNQPLHTGGWGMLVNLLQTSIDIGRLPALFLTCRRSKYLRTLMRRVLSLARVGDLQPPDDILPCLECLWAAAATTTNSRNMWPMPPAHLIAHLPAFLVRFNGDLLLKRQQGGARKVTSPLSMDGGSRGSNSSSTITGSDGQGDDAAADTLSVFLKLLALYLRRFSSSERAQVAALKRSTARFLRPISPEQALPPPSMSLLPSSSQQRRIEKEAQRLALLRIHLGCIVLMAAFYPAKEARMFLQFIKRVYRLGGANKVCDALSGESPESLNLAIESLQALASVFSYRGIIVADTLATLWSLLAGISERRNSLLMREARITATEALSMSSARTTHQLQQQRPSNEALALEMV
eukprot:jgi/Bigna1/66353/fgenesh1_pg.1_\